MCCLESNRWWYGNATMCKAPLSIGQGSNKEHPLLMLENTFRGLKENRKGTIEYMEKESLRNLNFLDTDQSRI